MMCFHQRSFNKVSVSLYNLSRENVVALEIQGAMMLKMQATRLIPTVLGLGFQWQTHKITQNLWHKPELGCPLGHRGRGWMLW